MGALDVVIVLLVLLLALLVLGAVAGSKGSSVRHCANPRCGHHPIRHKGVDASCASERVTNAAGTVVKARCTCTGWVEPEKEATS